MTFSVLAGWISAALFTCVQVPQIVHLYRVKRVDGISIDSWYIYAVALSFSIAYLLSLQPLPWPVLVNNATSLILLVIQIGMYHAYSNRPNKVLEFIKAGFWSVGPSFVPGECFVSEEESNSRDGSQSVAEDSSIDQGVPSSQNNAC